MKNPSRGFTLFLCCVLYSSCIFAHNSNKILTNFSYIGDFSTETAQISLNKMPPLDAFTASHILKLYKINYKTPAPNGEISIASGLVAMPKDPATEVGIVSYLHGTRFERDDVPSRNNERNHMYLAALGSTAGYMVVMPDYLGLGDNDLMLHPYVQAETLASSSINMLLAAKELAALLNYPINEKLYIAGYSEGGFSTIVMFESLINQYPDISITAVAAGSAPYGWRETMDFIMLKPGPRASAYLAYFFYSLQTYQHYWANLEEVFVSPYNTLIPELLDGKHKVPDILSALPLNPQLLFKPDFFDGIMNETDRNIVELKKNFNHFDFTPTAPFLMVGTKGDLDVPYNGAELAFQIYRKKSDLVFIKSVSDTLDHVQAHPYVLKEQVEFFKQYN